MAQHEFESIFDLLEFLTSLESLASQESEEILCESEERTDSDDSDHTAIITTKEKFYAVIDEKLSDSLLSVEELETLARVYGIVKSAK